VILLDTHIWLWWVHGDDRLRGRPLEILQQSEAAGLGVSVISCWEIAKLVECGRLDLSRPVRNWFDASLSYPGIQLLDLTPEIAAESAALPGEFHRDPADQMIVATARVHDCPVLTLDRKILDYPHVTKAS
jgi:PIN domain nuclease of toxin-antitoxin system